MTSVEVFAARDVIEGVPAQAFRSTSRSTVARVLAEVAARLRDQELAEAAAAKLEAEAAELAAYGGIAGAEAGWNALRQHNPKVDSSNGANLNDVHSFKDLSHKQKLNYAAFAFGVLNPGAKLGSPAPEESYQFKAGDKVRVIRGAHKEGIWVSARLLDIATVVAFRGVTTDVKDANRLTQGVPTSWLTLVTEPRTWDSAEEVPDGVRFAEKADPRWTWLRLSNGDYRPYCDGEQREVWRTSDVNEYAPFVEVIA